MISSKFWLALGRAVLGEKTAARAPKERGTSWEALCARTQREFRYGHLDAPTGVDGKQATKRVALMETARRVFWTSWNDSIT